MLDTSLLQFIHESLPIKAEWCMAPLGTKYAQTASEAEGLSQ